LPNATANAARQGYKGQRVHKMVGEANPRCEERIFEPIFILKNRFTKTGLGRT
jgi:hypothetical protein